MPPSVNGVAGLLLLLPAAAVDLLSGCLNLPAEEKINLKQCYDDGVKSRPPPQLVLSS